MGFVRTPEEMKAIAAAQAAGVFYAENVSVRCESDVEYLNSIVPDPLEVTENWFLVSTTRSQTNMLGDTIGILVNVPATFQGVAGMYNLANYYGPEAAVQWGRDLVGEPKKTATIGIHRFGSQRRAYADRHGTRIVAVEADVPTRVEPSVATGVIYTVRAQLGADWHSFEGRVGLLATHTNADIREEWTGTATVALASTPHDPLGDLPIHGILGAGARESRLTVTGQEIVAELDPEYYLPFHYGQHLDDWSKITPAAAMLDW